MYMYVVVTSVVYCISISLAMYIWWLSQASWNHEIPSEDTYNKYVNN